MDARRARLLREARDQFFDLLADDHHHVGELVDDDDDVRQRLEVRHRRWIPAGDQPFHFDRVPDRLALVGRFLDLAVVAGQVAHAGEGHQLVAALHLGDAPAQRVGGLLHVRHDRREQVWNALVHREFQHLRVDHDQPHVLRRALVEQRQHHRVDRGGLARAGGAADQQVRHAGEVGDDRIAADVLAEHERERRRHVVVGLRLDDFAERDHLARLVRDLETHRRLAGNDLDDAHADRRQRAREVLGEVRDLRDLHARRRPQFEAGDHRARVHFDDFGLDAEIAELEFDQARHRLERLGRIAADARRRIVEQRQRRQRRGARALEQRAPAFPSRRARSSRPWARAPRSSAACARRPSSVPRARRLRGPASLPCRCSGRDARTAARARTRCRAAPSVPIRSMTLSHDRPVASETEPSHTASSSSVAPRKLIDFAEALRRSSAPTTPPAVFGKPAPEKCSVASPQLLASARKKPRPRNEADATIDGLAAAARLEQPVAGDAEHDREQVGRCAEQHEEQVGQPGAERADQVGDRAGLAGGRERGVARS